jgi:hypothetical protein
MGMIPGLKAWNDRFIALPDMSPKVSGFQNKLYSFFSHFVGFALFIRIKGRCRVSASLFSTQAKPHSTGKVVLDKDPGI